MKDFDYNFDFGFSVVSEEELKNNVDVTSDVELWKQRAHEEREAKTALYAMIMPLLQNLRKNPKSEYILWKDREEKIREFAEKLTEIALGQEDWDGFDFTNQKK